MAFWATREMRTGFLWGNLREGDQLERLGDDGRIRLKWIIMM